MNLVYILARELKVWPGDVGAVTQSVDGELRDYYHCKIRGWDECFVNSVADDCGPSHEGNKGAAVTRAEWQAAVDALNAPKVVEWDGEGYPPIGLFCEYRGTESGIWSGCEIVATRNNAWVVLGDGYETDFVTLESLRPRRTAEQVASDERMASAYAMCAIAKSLTSTDALDLYDANYRKQVQP